MSDKEIVVNGLEWIINHKEILYERNKDFDSNELSLLDSTSLIIDRAFIINKSNKWSTIPLMLSVLYNHLSVCWEYMTDDEWKSLVDNSVRGLSKWKEAVESEDKKSLYESMITTLSYSGEAVAEAVFSSKRKTISKEWETEMTLNERIDRVEENLKEIEVRLNRQEETGKFLFDHIK